MYIYIYIHFYRKCTFTRQLFGRFPIYYIFDGSVACLAAAIISLVAG